MKFLIVTVERNAKVVKQFDGEEVHINACTFEAGEMMVSSNGDDQLAFVHDGNLGRNR